MKKSISALIAILLLGITSCANLDSGSDSGNSSAGSVNISFAAERVVSPYGKTDFIPSEHNWTLVFENTANAAQEKITKTVTSDELKAGSIQVQLPVGTYNIEASSTVVSDTSSASYDFYGKKEGVSVTADKSSSTSISVGLKKTADGTGYVEITASADSSILSFLNTYKETSEAGVSEGSTSSSTGSTTSADLKFTAVLTPVKVTDISNVVYLTVIPAGSEKDSASDFTSYSWKLKYTGKTVLASESESDEADADGKPVKSGYYYLTMKIKDATTGDFMPVSFDEFIIEIADGLTTSDQIGASSEKLTRVICAVNSSSDGTKSSYNGFDSLFPADFNDSIKKLMSDDTWTSASIYIEETPVFDAAVLAGEYKNKNHIIVYSGTESNPSYVVVKSSDTGKNCAAVECLAYNNTNTDVTLKLTTSDDSFTSVQFRTDYSVTIDSDSVRVLDEAHLSYEKAITLNVEGADNEDTGMYKSLVETEFKDEKVLEGFMTKPFIKFEETPAYYDSNYYSFNDSNVAKDFKLFYLESNKEMLLLPTYKACVNFGSSIPDFTVSLTADNGATTVADGGEIDFSDKQYTINLNTTGAIPKDSYTIYYYLNGSALTSDGSTPCDYFNSATSGINAGSNNIFVTVQKTDTDAGKDYLKTGVMTVNAAGTKSLVTLATKTSYCYNTVYSEDQIPLLNSGAGSSEGGDTFGVMTRINDSSCWVGKYSTNTAKIQKLDVNGVSTKTAEIDTTGESLYQAAYDAELDGLYLFTKTTDYDNATTTWYIELVEGFKQKFDAEESSLLQITSTKSAPFYSDTAPTGKGTVSFGAVYASNGYVFYTASEALNDYQSTNTKIYYAKADSESLDNASNGFTGTPVSTADSSVITFPDAYSLSSDGSSFVNGFNVTDMYKYKDSSTNTEYIYFTFAIANCDLWEMTSVIEAHGGLARIKLGTTSTEAGGEVLTPTYDQEWGAVGWNECKSEGTDTYSVTNNSTYTVKRPDNSLSFQGFYGPRRIVAVKNDQTTNSVLLYIQDSGIYAIKESEKTEGSEVNAKSENKIVTVNLTSKNATMANSAWIYNSSLFASNGWTF